MTQRSVPGFTVRDLQQEDRQQIHGTEPGLLNPLGAVPSPGQAWSGSERLPHGYTNHCSRAGGTVTKAYRGPEYRAGVRAKPRCWQS